MATKQRSRSRRSNNSRDRGPRYVEPVLDPTWQSPYSPSAAERLANQQAVRRFTIRRRLPQTLVVGVVVVALLVASVAAWWCALVAVAVGALYAWDFFRRLARAEQPGLTLGPTLLSAFSAGGSTKDRQRLLTVVDRLAATFGVDAVSAFIVGDEGYNAALVPDGEKYALFVTSALMRDFELIELEGVVAHCLARQRLGLLARQSVAATSTAPLEARSELAGAGTAYRADEVAAAAIRYPLGIAGALRKCARQRLTTSSYFASSAFAQTRWVWFDIWRDRTEHNLSDLDDVELRAMALEEW